jgi:hypothetical protein
MISRCYKYKEIHPAYHKSCAVCDEWLNFQNYADWYEENWYELPWVERLDIDKDILVQGNKLYSPEFCLLVPQSINLMFSNKTNNRGLPNGISKAQLGNGDYSYRAMYNTKSLGSYKCLEEAYDVYATEKEKAIKIKADGYKEWIPTKLYDAMYVYKVNIEIDKNYVA